MDKKLKKKFTGCVIGIVVCALLLSVFSFFTVVLSTSNQHMNEADAVSKLYSKIIVKLLPNHITGDDNGEEITFYMDYNENFDPEKDEPLRQFLPYYYEGEKRVDLPTGIYTSPSTGKTQQVTIGFFFAGQQKLKVFAAVVKVFIALCIITLLALIIYLAFLIWSYKQDKKDAEMYNAIAKRREKYNAEKKASDDETV